MTRSLDSDRDNGQHTMLASLRPRCDVTTPAACPANATQSAGRGDARAAAARVIASGLGFAAAPTFALMALLAAGAGAGPLEMTCSGHGASALTGMTAMYGLMAAFHVSPWLKLVSGETSRRMSGSRR